MDIQCHHQLEFNKNWKTKSIALFKNFAASQLPPLQSLVSVDFQILLFQFKGLAPDVSLMAAVSGGPFE
jgi:hypothetical protein